MSIRLTALLFLLFLIPQNALFAQQLFRSTQIIFNPYLINSAAAGIDKESSSIMMSYRQQWVGASNSPTTITMNASTFLSEKIGAGLAFFNDDAGGAISRTGVEISGLYSINLNSYDKVTFALSPVISSFQFDGSALQVLDENDPSLTSGIEKKSTFDSNFGLMVSGQNYFYGLSISSIFQSNLENVADVSVLLKNQNVRHFNFIGSFDYELNNDITLIPSGLIKFTGTTPVQLDAMVKASYKETFWFGITYRYRDAIAPSFGIKASNFKAGYSYDFTTTKSVRSLSPHTHEIHIGYLIPSEGSNGNNSGNGKSKKRYNFRHLK